MKLKQPTYGSFGNQDSAEKTQTGGDRGLLREFQNEEVSDLFQAMFSPKMQANWLLGFVAFRFILHTCLFTGKNTCNSSLLKCRTLGPKFHLKHIQPLKKHNLEDSGRWLKGWGEHTKRTQGDIVLVNYKAEICLKTKQNTKKTKLFIFLKQSSNLSSTRKKMLHVDSKFHVPVSFLSSCSSVVLRKATPCHKELQAKAGRSRSVPGSHQQWFKSSEETDLTGRSCPEDQQKGWPRSKVLQNAWLQPSSINITMKTCMLTNINNCWESYFQSETEE